MTRNESPWTWVAPLLVLLSFGCRGGGSPPGVEDAGPEDDGDAPPAECMECEDGQEACAQDWSAIRACSVDEGGCGTWVEETRCPADESCDDTTGDPECVPAGACLRAGATRCGEGDVLLICTEVDVGRLAWAPWSSCGTHGEICREEAGSARCVCECEDGLEPCDADEEGEACREGAVARCEARNDERSGCGCWTVSRDCAAEGLVCRERGGGPACGACVPDCEGRRCGDDGCGGTCGPGCESGEGCLPSGHCVRGEPGAWVALPGGSFTMGTPEDAEGIGDCEAHEVTLTHPFEILSTEVTCGEMERLLGWAYSCEDDDLPARNLSWHEAVSYCNALSVERGLEPCYECADSSFGPRCVERTDLASPYECQGYRLPTEAEWEHAARAGTTGLTYAGDFDVEADCGPDPVLDAIAWHCGDVPWGEGAHRVGTLLPNGYGLFDMIGNLDEWCHDRYGGCDGEDAVDPYGPAEGESRVVRGGSYSGFRWLLALGFRDWMGIDTVHGSLGFRPARTLPR